ncbi:MAG: MFS transporter [Bacillota bacterium]|nr:MFS transporter [Bacillota bacterium]
MNKRKGLNRWFVLFVLSIACGQIYQLPYLRYSYYDQMIAAFNVTNVQLGTFMTAFGLGSLICYLVGGLLAMKVSDKILLPGGLILTGLAGLWFAAFPPYAIALFISFFWAFSTSLIFWPAVINFVRGLGSSKEQGRLYGLFEGLRGITATVIGLVIVFIFNAAMSELAGLRTVIITYAVIAIVLGVIVFFVVPNNGGEKKALAASSENASLIQGFGKALKLPITWLSAGVVFFTMMVFDCLGYTTPYLTACLGASAAFAASFGTIRTWGLQFVGGTAGGIIADKIGSSSKTLVGGFAVIALGFAILALLPQKASMIWPAAIFIMVFGAAIYVNRGVYFAVMDEASVPPSINAAVVGIVSAIGFTPDAFIYTVIGYFLDNYPGALGYQITYWMGAGCAVCGLICAIVAVKYVKKQKAAAAKAQ